MSPDRGERRSSDSSAESGFRIATAVPADITQPGTAAFVAGSTNASVTISVSPSAASNVRMRRERIRDGESAPACTGALGTVVGMVA